MNKKIKKLLFTIVLATSLMLPCNAYAKEFNQSTLAQNNVNVDSIRTINISKETTFIEEGIFSQFKNLQQINVDSGNPNYASYDGCLYNRDFTRLICIPQGRKSVYVRTSVTSVAPHALDGLSQDRIDKVNILLGNTTSYSTSNNISSQWNQQKNNVSNNTSNNVSNNTSNTNNSYSNNSNNTESNSKNKITYNYSNPGSGKANVSPGSSSNGSGNNNNLVNKDDYGNTDMSKYVVTYAGHKYFMYTGSGVKDLYVPEGVEVIYQLSKNGTVNTDIETIHLPSTMGSFGFAAWLSNYGDNNQYSALQQCTNLKSVTGGSDTVRATGSQVYMNNKNGGQTLIWQSNSKIKYNRSAFF